MCYISFSNWNPYNLTPYLYTIHRYATTGMDFVFHDHKENRVQIIDQADGIDSVRALS